MMAWRIASNGVYALVVIAPPKECFAVLPKYFAGRVIAGANVTPSANRSDKPGSVE